MRVVVLAHDKSGHRDHGHYSKLDLASALDLFFVANRCVTCYNEGDPQTVISADPNP